MNGHHFVTKEMRKTVGRGFENSMKLNGQVPLAFFWGTDEKRELENPRLYTPMSSFLHCH